MRNDTNLRGVCTELNYNEGKPRNEKNKRIFFSCIAPHLNGLFVSAVEHLPVCFHKS